MITEQNYKNAVEEQNKATKVINDYFAQKREEFNKKMQSNPIFSDDDLLYSAVSLCPCGHGLAYPKECTTNHYWDCSAILKGIADLSVEHTGKLSFMFYDVKSESERNGTTRGVFRPQIKSSEKTIHIT